MSGGRRGQASRQASRAQARASTGTRSAAKAGSRTSAPGPARRAGAAPSAAPSAQVESGIRAVVWTTIPAALATEVGALAMIGFGPVAGVVAGYLGMLLLQVLLGGLTPAPAVVRAAILVGGPPLRYALIIVATWYEWAVRGSGPGPALVGAVLLAIVLPMIATAFANPRGPAQPGSPAEPR